MIEDARKLDSVAPKARMSPAFSFLAHLARRNPDPAVFVGPRTRVAQRVVMFSFILAAFVAPILLTSPHAVAQGCAMCYQNASASGAQGGAALRHGILILLLPALSVFLGIFVFIYRRRHVAR